MAVGQPWKVYDATEYDLCQNRGENPNLQNRDSYCKYL